VLLAPHDTLPLLLLLLPGLWLLSRKPVDTEGAKAMRALVEKMGLDTSALKPVAQAGCTYAPVSKGAAAPTPAAASSAVGVAAVKSAVPEPAAPAPGADPLAVTQKVELTIDVGGKNVGAITLAMFGNAAPITVANVRTRCRIQ
jgi:F420-0:gamma-glutamyl ligase-like protein